MAQVHAAVLHSGEEVVVKVLRPKMQQIIKQDVAIMYAIAELMMTYWPDSRQFKPIEVVREFEQNLLGELDLQREAANATQLKRNFQGYSTDKGTSIIGFGASAIGYLPLGYVQNTLDFEEYKKNILNEILPIKKGIKISEDDKLRKKIIDEIMCFLEVDLNKISRDFNLPENYFFDEINALKELERDGLIKIKNNKIKINPQARQIVRVVSSFFDKFFKHDNKKHSKIA